MDPSMPSGLEEQHAKCKGGGGGGGRMKMCLEVQEDRTIGILNVSVSTQHN